MATSNNTTSAKGTSTANHTVKEMQEWFEKNKQNIENFAKSQSAAYTVRDVTRSSTRSIPTIDKEALKSYIQSIGSNEKNLRQVARYLYYRSNVFFRLVNWYAGMWDLRCRVITPNYDLIKTNDATKMKKSFNDTLDFLDRLDIQGSIMARLVNVYIQDVSYAIMYLDDTGMFFYELEPDECVIETMYNTKDYGFAIDMSKWRSNQRQQIIEYLGSPLKEMYAEYERTGTKWVHCPDEYASVLKFRTDVLDTCIPPLLPAFLSFANLEDLVDIQADADDLSIYKLIYIPMKVHSSSKDVDDFELDPALVKKYFDRLIDDGTIPSNVGAAMVPGDELKTIDFSKTADSDTTSVEKAANQVLQTAGGGAVLNSNNITSTAAFNAWLKEETEFALSTLLPQVNGFVNRMLMLHVSNPCKVEHFEVSVYTREDKAKELLESCQYSFANRLAYNTCLGISERNTLAMLYFENDVLGLPNLMKYPLTSSFTSTGDTTDTTGGAPTKDDSEDIAESTDRMRNQ